MENIGGAPGSIEEQTNAVVRGKSLRKACCIGCVLFIAAVAIAAYAILRILTGPPTQNLTQLPANYPSDFALYRLPDAVSITYVPGKSRGKIFDIITSPIIALINSVGTSTASQVSDVKGVLGVYSAGLKGKDSVTVVWKDLVATRQDVLDYYAALFKRAGMTEKIAREEAVSTDLILARRKDAAIQLYLRDAPDVPNIEEVTVTVDYLLTK